MGKKLKKTFKIIGITLGSILGVAVLGVAGYNGIKYWRYSSFYSINEKVRNNPGINDDYITQGISYYEDGDLYLTSGYMSTKAPSRIYSINKDNHSRYCELYKIGSDGTETPMTSHCGGMGIQGENVYISTGSKIHILKKEDVLSNSKATVQKEVAVNNKASFMFVNENYLYVGEYYDPTSGEPNFNYVLEKGETCNSIVTQYSLASINLGIPVAVREYAIPNYAQGFAVTDSGKIVISTSHGISSSHFYVYDGFQNDLLGDQTDGIIPVNILDSRYLQNDIEGPSMAEDLDYHDGKVIFASESASNKYLYGKIFFYWYINALTIA